MDEDRAPEAGAMPEAPAATRQTAAAEDATHPPVAWAAPPAAPIAPTFVWVPEAPTPSAGGLPIGSVLSEVFARYGADPIRLYLLALLPSIVAILGVVSTSQSATLVATLLGLPFTATLMVLADRGPREPIGSAIAVGVSRTGWLLLTCLIVGILVAALPALTLLVGLILTGAKPSASTIVLLLVLLVSLVALWLFGRLTLAIPGVVVDRLRPNPALTQARAFTKPVSINLRLLTILFIVGLASTPPTLIAGVLLGLEVFPTGVVIVVMGALAAVTQPLASIAYVVAYRRLAASGEPTLAWEPPAPQPNTPAVRHGPVAAPPLRGVGRGLIVATIALAVGSVATIGWAIGQAVSSAAPTLGVPRGTVVFGTAASLTTCSVTGELTELPPGGSVAWIASVTARTTPTDRVRLVITLDGIEIANGTQRPGSFDCFGNEVPETDLDPGLYELTIFVNDEISARGSFIAR